MAMAEMPDKLRGFVDALNLLGDRSDRIQLLIDTAERYREVPEEIAGRPFEDSRKVPHCESDAYVWALDRPDGTLQFHFAVENPQGISAKAMAVILDETLSGAPPEQVLAVPSDLPYEIFGRELSMGKSMGLMGMVAKVQAEARSRLGGSEPAEAQRK